MLSVVIAAALAPNLGVVQAQTNSPYNQPASSGLSPYEYLAIATVIILAGLLLALFLLSRRRRPPTGTVPPASVWQSGSGSGGTSSSPPPPPGIAPAYLETPAEIGQGLPPAAGTMGAAAGAGAVAATAEGEPDIDTLMADLDKISSEVLKRSTAKKGPSGTGTETGGEPPAEE